MAFFFGTHRPSILRTSPDVNYGHIFRTGQSKSGDRHAGFAEVNANLALQNASLVCETLKLGAFYAGYVVAGSNFNARLSRLLKLPPNHKIYAGLAIGYPRFHYKNWIERKPARIQELAYGDPSSNVILEQ